MASAEVPEIIPRIYMRPSLSLLGDRKQIMLEVAIEFNRSSTFAKSTRPPERTPGQNLYRRQRGNTPARRDTFPRGLRQPRSRRAERWACRPHRQLLRLRLVNKVVHDDGLFSHSRHWQNRPRHAGQFDPVRFHWPSRHRALSKSPEYWRTHQGCASYK